MIKFLIVHYKKFLVQNVKTVDDSRIGVSYQIINIMLARHDVNYFIPHADEIVTSRLTHEQLFTNTISHINIVNIIQTLNSRKECRINTYRKRKMMLII